MRKLILLCVVLAAAVVVWKFTGGGAGADPLADLQQRLDAAERTYQSAGRAAGMSGMDTTADAEAALAEIERVESEARDLSRNASSEEVKARAKKLLERAAAVKQKIR